MTTTANHSSDFDHLPHLCPYWIAWLLASPVRRLGEDPAKLAATVASPGDRVLELGPGLGFYTLPLARRVGPSGRIIAIDSQQVMLDELARRCERAKLHDRVELRLGGDPLDAVDLKESIDVVVLVNVVHETQDPADLFVRIAEVLRPGAKVLLREPSGHCSRQLFEQELRWAGAAGLSMISQGKMVATLRAGSR